MRSWFVAALQRAQRRKSPWNRLLLLAVPLWALLWWGAFRLVWAYHVHLYPAHAGALRQFWPAGASAHAFVASFLMVFGPMMPAVVLALLVINALLWLVPPVRRTLEAEAGRGPGTGFRASQRKLLLATIVALAGWGVFGIQGAAVVTTLNDRPFPHPLSSPPAWCRSVLA